MTTNQILLFTFVTACLTAIFHWWIDYIITKVRHIRRFKMIERMKKNELKDFTEEEIDKFIVEWAAWTKVKLLLASRLFAQNDDDSTAE